MDTKQTIVTGLQQSDFLVDAYLADLSPKEMMSRPVGSCNHIAWQVGHLIQSERYLVNQCVPGKMPELPTGFAERHKKDTAGNDDPGAFLSKDEYIRLRKQIREGTLKVLNGLSPADFDKPVSGVPPFTKTIGEVFVFLGNHWLMHAGQWAVIRRGCGKPPLF